MSNHLSHPCTASAAQIDLRLPHAWNYIRDIRKRVHDALADKDPELRSAAMMAASELIENAVKYGEGVVAAPDILVSCRFDDDELCIHVTNGSKDMDGVSRLQERVHQITTTPDKEALYMARLEELLADPAQSGSLGLYRIAFEGRFELRVVVENDVVDVYATRRCR